MDMGAFEYRTDCNDNGVPDDTDILVGFSQDLNANGLPDECDAFPGDLNFDGIVDIFDLLLVLAGWGLCPEPPGLCFGDANFDGAVNIFDLLEVLAEWSVPTPR